MKKSRTKSPSGVAPYSLWAEVHEDPSLKDYADRYEEVLGAIQRYRIAGLDVNPLWLMEVGVTQFLHVERASR